MTFLFDFDVTSMSICILDAQLFHYFLNSPQQQLRFSQNAKQMGIESTIPSSQPKLTPEHILEIGGSLHGIAQPHSNANCKDCAKCKLSNELIPKLHQQLLLFVQIYQKGERIKETLASLNNGTYRPPNPLPTTTNNNNNVPVPIPTHNIPTEDPTLLSLIPEYIDPIIQEVIDGQNVNPLTILGDASFSSAGPIIPLDIGMRRNEFTLDVEKEAPKISDKSISDEDEEENPLVPPKKRDLGVVVNQQEEDVLPMNTSSDQHPAENEEQVVATINDALPPVTIVPLTNHTESVGESLLAPMEEEEKEMDSSAKNTTTSIEVNDVPPPVTIVATEESQSVLMEGAEENPNSHPTAPVRIPLSSRRRTNKKSGSPYSSSNEENPHSKRPREEEEEESENISSKQSEEKPKTQPTDEEKNSQSSSGEQSSSQKQRRTKVLGLKRRKF